MRIHNRPLFIYYHKDVFIVLWSFTDHLHKSEDQYTCNIVTICILDSYSSKQTTAHAQMVVADGGHLVLVRLCLLWEGLYQCHDCRIIAIQMCRSWKRCPWAILKLQCLHAKDSISSSNCSSCTGSIMAMGERSISNGCSAACNYCFSSPKHVF